MWRIFFYKTKKAIVVTNDEFEDIKAFYGLNYCNFAEYDRGLYNWYNAEHTIFAWGNDL